MDNYYLDLAKKHKRRLTFATLIFIWISVSFLDLQINLILKIILAIAIFFIPSVLLYAVKMHKAKNYLYEEFDPQKYYAVASVYDKNIMRDDFDFSYLTGNYSNAIKICNNTINKTKNSAVRILNKYYLALCYFETGDLNKLREICDELHSILSNDKNAKIYKEQYGAVVEYFTAFLNEDYEKCKEIKGLNDEHSNKRKLSKFYKLKIQFYYAVACYKNNEYDSAVSVFNEISNVCPKLSLGKLSAQYLNLINGKDETNISDNEYNYSAKKETFVALPEKEMGKGKKVVLAVILLIALAYICFSGYSAGGTAENVLAEEEGATAVLEIIPINEDGDALCIYEKHENYGIAYLDYVGEDKYKYGIATTHGISPHNDVYYIKAPDSNLKIRYVVSNTEANKYGDEISQYKFTYGDRTAYLHILSVEKAYCLGYVISLEYQK